MNNVPPASTASKGTGVKKSAAKKLKSTVPRTKSSLDEQEKHHDSLAQISLLQPDAVHAQLLAPAEPLAENQEVQVQERIQEAVEVEDNNVVEQSGETHRAEPGPPPATNDQKTPETRVSNVVKLWTTPAPAHPAEPGSPPAKNDLNIQEDSSFAAATEISGKLKSAAVLLETLRAIDVDNWKEQCPEGHKLNVLPSHHKWHECSVCTRPQMKSATIRWCVLCQWRDGSQFVLCEDCTPSSDKQRKRSRDHLKARLQAQDLLDATEYRDIEKVEWLLASRADPSCKVVVVKEADQRVGDKRVWYCLHAAAKAGFHQVIPIFLSHGAQPNVKDSDGRSPLHIAVVAREMEVIKKLVEGRADVNAQDSFGQGPIHLAAACRKGPEAKDILIALLDARADANVEDLASRVPYELEADENPVILEVRRLYDHARDYRKEPASQAKTKLARCVTVKRRVDRVLEPYRRDPQYLRHARQLCLACAKGDVETVRILLECQADVGFRAPGEDLHVGDLPKKAPIPGWTPLHAAVEREALDIVRMLLIMKSCAGVGRRCEPRRAPQGKADVDAAECSFDQLRPIHRAARSGNVSVLRELASARADVDAETWTKKNSPLHLAAAKGHAEIAKTLVELKANVCATNLDGQTALHTAAAFGQLGAVEALLALQSHPMIKDIRGQVAMHLALQKSHVDIAKRLLAAGGLNKLLGGEEVVPHFWATLINRRDALSTAIFEVTREVFVNEHVIANLRATFCTVSPKTLLVQAPEDIIADGVEALSLIPTTEGQALPFWSTLTRPPITCRGRLMKLDLGCDPTHQAIIRAFANTPNEAAHSTQVATAILEHAWGGVEVWYYCEVLWCYAVLACACSLAKHLNEEGEAPHRELVVMLVGIAKRALDEFAQLFDVASENIWRNQWNVQAPATLNGDFLKVVKPVGKCEAIAYATFTHIINPMNQVDIGCLILDTAAVMAAFNFHGTQLQTGLIGVSGAMMWLRALYLLRGSRRFGTRLLPILSAVKDTLAFFVVMAFVIAAVTHYYYLTGGAGTGLFTAFEKVYRLCLWADFDIVDWQGLSPGFVMVNNTVNGLEWVPEDPPHTDMYPLLQFLFYVTTICVTVIFMNLLIAILGENFSEYETRGSTLFQRERANLIITLRCSSIRHAFLVPYRLARWARAAAMKLAKLWDSTERSEDSTERGSARSYGSEAWKADCFYLACLIFPSGMTRYHYKYWDKDTNPKLVFLEKAEECDIDTTGEIRSTRFFLNQQMTATEKRLSQQLQEQRVQLRAVQGGQYNLVAEVADLRRDLLLELREASRQRPPDDV